MRVVGIVAEYNPFHNGHRYQIEYAKEVLKADKIIIAMSGNFTQRGLPAICDKRIRAESAVNTGADCVLEMPVNVSIADTPMFAQGAVDILASFGCNALLFGSELNNIQMLKCIAEVMLGDAYHQLYNDCIEHNIKPPTARELAIENILNLSNPSLINHPNNLLGIYYICAVNRKNYPFEIYTNPRLGQDYFDERISKNTHYASATAIRASAFADNFETVASPYVPSDMMKQLVALKRRNTLVRIEDFESRIINAILNCSQEEWRSICEVIPQDCVPYAPIAEVAENTHSYREIRNKFLEYASPIRTDRMICWLLLRHKRLCMDEFISSDHIGYNVLSSRDQEKTGSCTASKKIKEEWKHIDRLYEEIIFGKQICENRSKKWNY